MTQHEQAIIGYALNHQDPLPLLKLRGKFSKPSLNQLASMASVIPCDLLHFVETSEKLGLDITSVDLVAAMNGSMAMASTLPAYIRSVEEQYIIHKAEKILQHTTPITLESIAELVKQLTEIGTVQTEDPTVAQAIKEFETVQERFVEAHAKGSQIVGYSTGLWELDKITDGLQLHHLWTLAAYTSAGKTTLALNVVRELLKQGASVVFYSLEMSRPEIYAKLLSMEANLSTWKLKRAGINQNDFAVFQETREKSKAWKLKIYDTKNDIDDLILSIKEESLRGVNVVVIDYLQNIADKKARSEYELITNAIHDIQNTTLALPISTILVSQISNEDFKNTSALSVNAKGSGSVRAASDIFIFLQNVLKDTDLMAKLQTNENIPMRLFISKNRHGRIGVVEIERTQETGIFHETVL